MNQTYTEGISIQVSLSGYSFSVRNSDGIFSRSSWKSAETVFTSPELQKSYPEVELSFMTPKIALLPSAFFDPSTLRDSLSRTVDLAESDEVCSVEVPEYAAVLAYSLSMGEKLSGVVASSVSRSDGQPVKVMPEMYFILKDILKLEEYNRIVASYADGYLHLAVAQGRNLLISNVFSAVDFTTAEYFIFLTLKKLQLNPEVSTIWFRTPLTEEQEMSLYRYFKGVERI